MNLGGQNVQSIEEMPLSLRWSGETSLNCKRSEGLGSERFNFLAKDFSAKDAASCSTSYFVEMNMVL